MPQDSQTTHGHIWAYAGAFESNTFFVFGNTQKQNQRNFKALSYRPGGTGWSTESGIENYVRNEVGLGPYYSCGNAVGHNGKIYLLGWDSSTPEIIIYDVDSKQMSLGPSDPKGPRKSFAMGIFDGAIFIAGGSTYVGGNPSNQFISSVYRLEVGGDEWQPMAPMPGTTTNPNAAHGGYYGAAEASAEVEGKWWVRFRDDEQNVLGKVWVYDGRWKIGGNYPGKVGDHYSNDYGTNGEWNCAQFATV